MLIVGTFIKVRIIHYLLQPRSKSTSTTIQLDDLILFEQEVNLINGLLIFAQLLPLFFPSSMREILGNTVFCSSWVALAMFALFHRAIGGFGIALVRQVMLISCTCDYISKALTFPQIGFCVSSFITLSSELEQKHW